MKVGKNINNGIGSYRWTESVMGAGIQSRAMDPGSAFYIHNAVCGVQLFFVDTKMTL